MSNKTYLCVHRSQPGQRSGHKPSPAQMEQMYEKFNTWRETFKDNIVDMGGRLEKDGRVVSTEGVKDGPFAEAKEIIGGFMILSATSIDEAADVTAKMPGLGSGSTIEVREITTS